MGHDNISGGKRRGLTRSKGGVPLVAKGRKRRKFYPPSWGCAAEKMDTKKRVVCVYDGPRRLFKDEMMLKNVDEVRVPLGNGHYVTDLDLWCMRRIEAQHNTTEAEKGPWIEDGEPVDVEKLMQ